MYRLYELRSSGITTYRGGRTFRYIKGYHSTKMNLISSSPWNWKYLTESNDSFMKIVLETQVAKKRKSAPLNIIGITMNFFSKHENHIILLQFSGLSNYDKLSKDEQELCSMIRIIPDAYLTYKKLLMAENTKIGYLRLADARKLIKIDVNKTRVMYDFFFEHGFINKPLNNKP